MSRKRLISLVLVLIMSSVFIFNIPLTALASTPTSDSFVAGTMDSQWSILRPVTTGPLAYELVKGRGLKLMTQASGMQTDATSIPSNVFLRSGNASQWEAVAKIYFPLAPQQNYQQMAFGVYQDENNYVKLDIEFNTTARRVQFSINRNGTYSHTHYTNLNNGIFPAALDVNRNLDLVAYYKITKTGDVYKASVSFDGVTYFTVGDRSGTTGGSNTNGEYTVTYSDPKLYVSAIKDYDVRSPAIDTYCEFVKIYGIDGVPFESNVLDLAFRDVENYVVSDTQQMLASVPGTASLAAGNTYNALSFPALTGLPLIPYGYSYRLTSENPSVISVNSVTNVATARRQGTAVLKLELAQETRTRLLKTVNVTVAGGTDAVAVEFYYNYTGEPARPASFSQQTVNGKLESLPVEQTLPQVGARPDYGFVGWYTNPEGTGEKVTLDTVFSADTNLYAKWEQVPSLWQEYEDYFLMGAFGDFNANSAQMTKHYNINCPSNSFKLNSQINTTTMRNNFVAARTSILADETMTVAEKEAALQTANEQVVLAASPTVINMLNNMRIWNAAHPDDKKYTRFHVVAWHGGQQPNQFFTNAFQYSNDATSLARAQNLSDADQDGAFASRETMKARLDNYIEQVMARYAPYKDIIISWDIINEPVDDFTGQIRNGTDSGSQRGQWGLVWHDKNPAKNPDGTPKFTSIPDAMGVINDPARLYDESEWMRWALESAAKWSKENDCDWGLYVNDYMDSNKLYTKLQPTLDIMKDIRNDVDLKGIKLGWGMQGRLAWAYPTIDMLRKQVEDGLEICEQMAVTEGDIRSDFEPNPLFDPTQRTRPVLSTDTPKWNTYDLNCNSGSTISPTSSTLTNTFDTHNSPVRRIPEWGTGNGMTGISARYNATGFLAISESVMKKQADFAADWMDILINHADKVELFQWDGTTDSSTFNSNKGAHLWVSGVTGRTGTFEKYSFFAVIGAPARAKMRDAIKACPALTDASKFAGAADAWNNYVKALNAANALVDKRIYTLEGVNEVKAATSALYAAAAVLEQTSTLLTYDPNGGAASIVKEAYAPSAGATVKSDAALGFARAGYTFTGWNTAANGRGTTYAAGVNMTMDKNVTLFAQWKAVPTAHTVTFESYDGTDVAPVSVADGGKVPRPADPSKLAYRFAGWYRDMALTNPWDFANGTVTANMRLYAKWVSAIEFKYGREVAVRIEPGKTLVVNETDNASGTAPQTMIVALYDAEGALVKYVTVGGTIISGLITFSATIDIPADTQSGAGIKVFVWETNALIPVRGTIVF